MKYNKISDIPHSDYVEITETDNNVNIKINKPTENMQTDMANFEALAIMYKCIKSNIYVTIEFENYDRWNGKFGSRDKDSNTYLRFLYRVVTFKEAFPSWVQISEYNKKEISRFEMLLNEELKAGKVSNNIPNSEPGFNPEKRKRTCNRI